MSGPKLKAEILSLGKCDLQMRLKTEKYVRGQNGFVGRCCNALGLPLRRPDKSYYTALELKNAILAAVPNLGVTKHDLFVAGAAAVAKRLQDATMSRGQDLMSENKPGLLRDCAAALNIPLRRNPSKA